ncbi:MAG: ATP-binding cassette domain-containing protein [Actinomycetota bacterium]|nr:ATP-binding cassette domain-containing protein [Actinomycetota bacterium]
MNSGLQLEAVTRDFAGVRAVAGVSVTLGPGEMLGVIGPNGSGKTTLVNLASGAIAPSAGRVMVDGVDLTGAHNASFAAAGVVRSYQGLRLFEGMSVFDNVMVGAQRGVRPSLIGAWARPPGFRRRERRLRDASMEALDQLGMAGFAAQAVGALSHGQRRRVELARAFAADPAYLVLDEPGAGVDPDQLASLTGIIADRGNAGVGILVVEHDHGWVERTCQRVLGMADGSVVADGTFAVVAAHPALAPHLGATSRSR